MLKISDFFKKIQNKHSKELFVRSSIQVIIKKHVGVDIPVESISIKSSSIYLKNQSQSARSQIFIRKQGILDDTNNLLKPQKIIDIR